MMERIVRYLAAWIAVLALMAPSLAFSSDAGHVSAIFSPGPIVGILPFVDVSGCPVLGTEAILDASLQSSLAVVSVGTMIPLCSLFSSVLPYSIWPLPLSRQQAGCGAAPSMWGGTPWAAVSDAFRECDVSRRALGGGDVQAWLLASRGSGLQYVVAGRILKCETACDADEYGEVLVEAEVELIDVESGQVVAKSVEQLVSRGLITGSERVLSNSQFAGSEASGFAASKTEYQLGEPVLLRYRDTSPDIESLYVAIRPALSSEEGIPQRSAYLDGAASLDEAAKWMQYGLSVEDCLALLPDEVLADAQRLLLDSYREVLVSALSAAASGANLSSAQLDAIWAETSGIGYEGFFRLRMVDHLYEGEVLASTRECFWKWDQRLRAESTPRPGRYVASIFGRSQGFLAAVVFSVLPDGLAAEGTSMDVRAANTESTAWGTAMELLGRQLADFIRASLMSE